MFGQELNPDVADLSDESKWDVLERRRGMRRLLFGVQQSKRDILVLHITWNYFSITFRIFFGGAKVGFCGEAFGPKCY